MNITHMKYALEISRQGSLNKAAEALFIAQPNLSRAIKELEGELGVSLFVRSGKGMEPTPEGAIFLEYAEKILKKMDEVADLFKAESQSLQRFSLCGPRSSYISAAFQSFALLLAQALPKFITKRQIQEKPLSLSLIQTINLV